MHGWSSEVNMSIKDPQQKSECERGRIQMVVCDLGT